MTYHNKVILFESTSPPPWSFFDFGYSATSNPIEDWYQTQLSDWGRQAFNAQLKNNHKIQSHANWGMKYMQGILKGEQIWQWTIPAEVQYRVLGMFNGQKRAVFLMGYYHKGGSYTPSGALETALKRKKLLEKGQCVLHERPIKLDQ